MVTEISKIQIDQGVFEQKNIMHVIMFYGNTCGPCKNTMPFYDEAAEKYVQKTDKIKFFKIHAWEEEYGQYYKEVWDINGVPHFRIMFNGQAVYHRNGGGDLNTMMKVVHDGIDEVFKQFGERL